MIGYNLFTLGGLIFAILLVIVYHMRAKESGINNALYRIIIFLIIPVIISKLLATTTIYYFPDNTFIGDFWSRTHSFFMITWLMAACCYLISLGNEKRLTTIKEILHFDGFKAMLIIYITLIVVSQFLEFENVRTDDFAYMGGPGFYFMFIASIFYLILSIFIATRNKNKKIRNNRIAIAVGTIIITASIVIQAFYPESLLITSFIVFELYLIYFAFENPDLYLIEELGLSKKKAEDSNRAKTDFLSNMSHEIRTPMNAILGFSEGILNEEKFNEDIVKKDIAHIYSAGTNLLEIINNILDISKIETGEEKVELKEYSIGNVVLELKSIIESRIDTSKIKFITNIDANTPSKLLGDKTKIFQVLLNILSNSVKYTEVGRITLAIQTEVKGSQAFLKFKISDTGFGIKKEDYEKIFEKFSRLDIATEKEIEGTGLGLVITKRLVNLMGGEIWFESEYGAGTNFYIDLSQRIIDKTPLGDITIDKAIEEEQEYIDCSGFKVLIVDDNKLNLMVAEKVLSPYNFEITKIDNGKDCVNNIKMGNEYDIIFLDHMMPSMDGIEVLHILHKLEEYKIPPIVALTANAITGNKEMYLNEGFDEYLPKPINISDLDKLIRKYFANKTNNKIKKTQANKKENNKQSTEEIDKVQLLKDNGIDVDGALSFVGDMNNYNEMIKVFYEEIDDKIKSLKEAKDADDMKNYAILVHGLKSECRFLGINKFADQAYEQEIESKAGNTEFIIDHFKDLVISKKKTKDIIKEYLDL